MDILNFIIFIILSSLTCIFAVWSLLEHRMLYSVLQALISFLCVALIFLFLGAEFVAISQLFLYGVGVGILLIFANMFTSKEAEEALKTPHIIKNFLALSACIVLFLSFLCFLTAPNKNTKIFSKKEVKKEKIEQISNVSIVGNRIINNYPLSLEMVGIIMLVTIAGVGYFAKGEKDA